MSIKHTVRSIPVIGPLLARAYVWIQKRKFSGSRHYWERRYAEGGNSGDGSYGELAVFKAEVLNKLVREESLKSVIEFGSGDGHQLTLAEYPKYLGVDVSSTAIELCEKQFADDLSKRFVLSDDYRGETADLALSLDVIYHLVEDSVFHGYMEDLFNAAARIVVIYASNTDEQDVVQTPHVRHRKFTRWVEENRPTWTLDTVIENRIPPDKRTGKGSFADFYLFRPSS